MITACRCRYMRCSQHANNILSSLALLLGTDEFAAERAINHALVVTNARNEHECVFYKIVPKPCVKK